MRCDAMHAHTHHALPWLAPSLRSDAPPPPGQRRELSALRMRGELSGQTCRDGHSGTDEDAPPPAVPREVQLFKTRSKSDIHHPVLSSKGYCSASLSHCSLRSQPPRVPLYAAVFSEAPSSIGTALTSPRGR